MADDNKTDPTKFLSSIIGSSVVVRLHNGILYEGNLQSIDGYMNVVLDSAKEYVNEVAGKAFGDVFIRGNNGMLFYYKEFSIDFITNY
ncbi:CIC11C00000002120 [Sungouiella intermedia]|uniref:CIC11C00000002120 n=2 Tax=Sungouiella intermedia TaxID=45354 RepID=A0A1L0BH92_9ASCO|nr:CIC11C00000002120 [[Candida] intermedia]